jgi:hypothetical protein
MVAVGSMVGSERQPAAEKNVSRKIITRKFRGFISLDVDYLLLGYAPTASGSTIFDVKTKIIGRRLVSE